MDESSVLGVTALTSAGVRRNARWMSLRRGARAFIVSPLVLLLSLPNVRHPEGDSIVLETFAFLCVIVELISDISAAFAGDPLVIYGKVLEQPGWDFERVTGLGTFGYELTIDLKRAVRIARDGRVTDAADCIESDASVRSTRHVYRQIRAGQEVILLCNSTRTALAVESEIRDAALISALRGAPAEESGEPAGAPAGPVTAKPDRGDQDTRDGQRDTAPHELDVQTGQSHINASHYGRPASWVAVSTVIVGFVIGGIAMVIGPTWWLFWAGAGIVVIGGIYAARVRTFDDWY
jgi:hypothetical protein